MEGKPIVPETLDLPDNLFVIGTVNVDETTYMFSPKVLDRANVIEFRVGKTAARDYLATGGGIGDIAAAPAGYAEAFLDLSRRARTKPRPDLDLLRNPEPPADAKDALESSRTAIEHLFLLMKERHLEFGFRPMAEILRYLAVDYELTPDEAEWNWKPAMDAQILQKILPKLHGSKRKIGSLLGALATYCEAGNPGEATKVLAGDIAADSYPAEGDKLFESPLFPDSHRKLCEMIVSVRRDQFVSFIQ